MFSALRLIYSGYVLSRTTNRYKKITFDTMKDEVVEKTSYNCNRALYSFSYTQTAVMFEGSSGVLPEERSKNTFSYFMFYFIHLCMHSPNTVRLAKRVLNLSIYYAALLEGDLFCIRTCNLFFFVKCRAHILLVNCFVWNFKYIFLSQLIS